MSQFFRIFCGSLPLAYLGAMTALGYWGLYLGFLAETSISAAINYWQFRTNKWKTISESYRPNVVVSDD